MTNDQSGVKEGPVILRSKSWHFQKESGRSDPGQDFESLAHPHPSGGQLVSDAFTSSLSLTLSLLLCMLYDLEGDVFDRVIYLKLQSSSQQLAAHYMIRFSVV